MFIGSTFRLRACCPLVMFSPTNYLFTSPSGLSANVRPLNFINPQHWGYLPSKNDFQRQLRNGRSIGIYERQDGEICFLVFSGKIKGSRFANIFGTSSSNHFFNFQPVHLDLRLFNFLLFGRQGHPNGCSASRFEINWGKPAPQGGIAEIERPTGLKYGIPLLPHELHFF